MEIKRNNGKKTEIWILNSEGISWYETYGPSMTDIATSKSIENLLNLTDENRITEFENSLPDEINGLKNVFEIILVKIIESKSAKKDVNSEFISRIKKRINQLTI